MKTIYSFLYYITTRILIVAAIGAISLFFILEGPQIHASYLRSFVGSKTFKILSKDGSNGGTGFLIKAPSGKTYILTNAHICVAADNNPYTEINGRSVKLSVIEVSEKTDLCLIKYYGNKKGLKIASSVKRGEIVGLVGHPNLLPLALTKGEILGETEIKIDIPSEFCDKEGPWSKIDKFNYKDLSTTTCQMSLNGVLQTNLVALGGNSGSAVVNFYGNVVGVLFATRSSANWGAIIPIEHINDFLSPY